MYAFINEVLPVKKCEGVDIAKSIVGNTGYYLAFEKVVIASDKPKEIHFNEERQLHSIAGPALLYRDGYGVYALDGIRLTPEIFENIKSKKSAQDIMFISNVEQRLVAIKYFGIENMLSELKSQTCDKKGDEYELLSVEIEGSREKLLKMKNPSEPKDHYEFVAPEIETVNQAMAWRLGWDSYKEPVMKA